jgi:hypothetical protein
VVGDGLARGQIHLAEGRFSLEGDARYSCATNCEIRLTRWQDHTAAQVGLLV